MSPMPAPTAADSVPVEAAPGTVAIEAPMVGTFYRAPSPTGAPYVREGDVIKESQVVCIIEAMKLMNEIEAEIDAEIVEILVANGQPVEFGEVLFRLRPLAS